MSTVKEIVFWGTRGQAIVLEEFLVPLNFRLTAVFDNDRESVSPFKDVKIYYGKNGLAAWASRQADIREVYFAPAIGDNKTRLEIGEELLAFGLKSATLIHPRAYVAANAVLGRGTQILAHATVCARAILGDFVTVNTKASVDHECVLESGVQIAPGATLAGCIQVKKNAFIGTGATVLPRVTIGENAIIGAGATVISDIPDNAVAVGTPAKVIRVNA